MNISQLADFLGGYQQKEILFIGLGNTIRGDDSSGIHLVDRIKSSSYFKYSTFIQAGLNPENYLSQICEVKPAVIIFADMCRWGGTPGEINILSSAQISPAGYSTHSYSVRLIEEYIRNNFKTEFFYICIEPLSTTFDSKLSPDVSCGIENFFNS